MTTITFDTLTFVEELTAAGFTADQAKGQARALTKALEQVEDARVRELATKGDIQELRQEITGTRLDLRREIAETKAELIKWMFGVAAGQAAFIIAMLKLLPSP